MDIGDLQTIQRQIDDYRKNLCQNLLPDLDSLSHQEEKTIKKYLMWLNTKIYLNNNYENAKNRSVKRGEIYNCELGIGVGSEIRKKRKVVIIQNDRGNKYSGNTIVSAITSGENFIEEVNVKIDENKYKYEEGGETKYLNGLVDLTNIRTVSKARLGDFIAKLDDSDVSRIEKALLNSLGIT